MDTIHGDMYLMFGNMQTFQIPFCYYTVVLILFGNYKSAGLSVGIPLTSRKIEIQIPPCGDNHLHCRKFLALVVHKPDGIPIKALPVNQRLDKNHAISFSETQCSLYNLPG